MNSTMKYFLAICVMVAACTKPVDDTATDSARILGKYSFDGKVENILSVEHAETDSEVSFVFSPVFKGRRTTHIDFSLSKDFLNMELDVEELSHSEDYHFTYENPVWYYSQAWPLKMGTMWVKELEDGVMDVYIDAQLHDGTPFTLSYTGKKGTR